MEIAITVSVIIIGVLWIHLLNAQHDERIAAFHYGDTLPGIGRRSRKGRRAAEHAGSPIVTTHQPPRAPRRGRG